MMNNESIINVHVSDLIYLLFHYTNTTARLASALGPTIPQALIAFFLPRENPDVYKKLFSKETVSVSHLFICSLYNSDVMGASGRSLGSISASCSAV